jgi:hypothetical protein
VQTEFSESCLDDAIAEEVAELNDFCLDSTTLMHYNDKLAKYERITCDYSCSDGGCITEEEAEGEITEAELTDNLLSGLGIDLGIFNVFFSVFMVANYILISLSGVAIYLTQKWEFGAIVVLILIMSLTFVGMYPLEIALVIGTGIGLWLANSLRNMFISGG